MGKLSPRTEVPYQVRVLTWFSFLVPKPVLFMHCLLSKDIFFSPGWCGYKERDVVLRARKERQPVGVPRRPSVQEPAKQDSYTSGQGKAKGMGLGWLF